MSIPRYTWRESTEMTSPSSRFATSTAIAVLPLAVGPRIAIAPGSAMTAEAALQLLQRETHDRGTAVHVVVRQVGREQPIEQLLHLPRAQRLARLDRGLACKGHRDALVLVPCRTRQLAPCGQLGEDRKSVVEGKSVDLGGRRLSA